MNRLLTALLTLPLCVPVVDEYPFTGEAPPSNAARAVIDGPTTGQPGDLIHLDFSPSTADRLKFFIKPDRFADGRPTHVVDKDGLGAWIATRPGTYEIELLVSNAEGPDRRLETITISPAPGGPGSPPAGPPAPVPVTVATWVRDAAQTKVTKDSDRAGTAKALAKVYRQSQTSLAGLSPIEFVKSQDILNGAILAQRKKTAEWADWRRALADKLAGLDLQTTPELIDVWGEIANGLEGVR